MSVDAGSDFGQKARRLRVDTLIRLRWLAIFGQSAAVLFTYYGLGFHLPFGLCFAAIAAAVWLNLGLRLRFPINHRLGGDAATVLLAFDLVQLSALLFFTGGLQNPFAVLFLAPIMISAVSLSVARTILLMTVMVAMATALSFYSYPLPWKFGEEPRLPLLYIAGVWMAIVLGAAFISAYAFRVAEETRRLSDALAATELVLAREQHLTQLDGLAAAAAHELGTPLATITLVVKEMRRAGAALGPYEEDVALLEQEAQRCRTILGKLKSLGDGPGDAWGLVTLGHLIEDVIAPSRDFDVEIEKRLAGEGAEPMCAPNPGIIYGLGNLVENAVDFAETSVMVEAHWTQDRIWLVIADDGPGFSPEVLAKLGEPYITTQTTHRRAKSGEGGLGLGVFIAKTLLERSGAAITMGNAEDGTSGARITIAWPREAFEASSREGGAD